jgi:hypothetical protein
VKTQKLAPIVTIVLSFVIRQWLFGQGSLTPPGAPAPTMKTLDQIEARTPVSLLPFTITNAGSYYLTRNLTGDGAHNGITISSGNVTLDLNGFALVGAPGFGGGVLVSDSFTNITVRNGSISGWPGNGMDGYSFAYPRNVVCERLTVSQNGGFGIAVEASSIVRDCLVLNNGSDGIFTVGSLITGCVARDNRKAGINAANSIIRSCLSHFNQSDGVNVENSTVMDCDLLDNGTNGVAVGSNCQIVGNRIADNGVAVFTGGAILLNGTHSRIESNMIANNYSTSRAGALTTNNIFLKNVISGSFVVILGGGFNISPNATAPDGSGSFTNNNPWLNIRY